MECRIGSRYAAVFPDPVFALARISRPSNAKGIALLCTGVGVLKFSLVIPWRSRVSSPRLAKVFSSFCASNSSAGTGTSLASNFRFMLAVWKLFWLRCNFENLRDIFAPPLFSAAASAVTWCTTNDFWLQNIPRFTFIPHSFSKSWEGSQLANDYASLIMTLLFCYERLLSSASPWLGHWLFIPHFCRLAETSLSLCHYNFSSHPNPLSSSMKFGA